MLLTALVLAAAPVDDRGQVIAAVDSFMEAIRSGDRTAFERVLHPDGIAFIHGYVEGRHGLRLRPNKQTVEGITGGTSRFVERYWNPTVLVHRDIAHFWAPYSFDVDGKRSHCGIDSFSLVRVEGEWKLTNMSWTVEPLERCAELGESKP
ncbi:MAG TPA: hypothetical protein VFO51_05055 [Sphingomicrobium sp.]|nr:hypothetical protein [Sphingomicrobium sp.]